ncbi:hypothetical protein JCM19231_5656 [Vibrio ishigakensis]|uniref:ATPase n=1 Tax=Vibrio ishigakensis TaxID=1481914 RepID=A0A0B8NZ65_9VIBR|nr:hypothetical protein [Vibrio ishigakensis]GAM56019.1 hypothetical protein JCM19231_5656 [Vibrio ishigakensis]
MKKRHIAVALCALSTLGGCATYNLVKGAALMKDYNLLAAGDAVFNSERLQEQFSIPNPLAGNIDRILVCYNDAGLFRSKEEGPLQEVAEEWLQMNKDFNTLITESKDKSGVWDSRTCYEFTYQEVKPIGAYLDEETEEVVVVGEQALPVAKQ